MKRFRNILFLSNPKAKQKAAIRRARSLAEQNDARLTILTVLKASRNPTRTPADGTLLDELEARMVHDEQVAAERLADDCRQSGIDVQTKVVVGIPFVEAIREVLREGHDLVVLATDSRHRFVNRLFGSTSMHLMRKCPCPVWVVKPGSDKPYRRILAAVDTASDPWGEGTQAINPMIVQLAGSLAQSEGSELHLVQVWSVANEGYLQVRGGVSDETAQRMRDETKRAYGQRLRQLAAAVDTDAIGKVRLHLKHGDDPAEVIVKLAQKQKVDLLVMGTVCRTGLAGFFIGNTAEEVLAAVDCSVLTVKPQGFVSPVTVDSR